jgi:mono/diheme cytochrome c family protein
MKLSNEESGEKSDEAGKVMSMAKPLDVGLPGACLALLALVLSAGCHSDMYDQQRGKPLAASRFYEDGQAARPLVEGELLQTGKVDGRLSDTFPFPVTAELLRRGRERYDIYCTPCHGLLGDGKGMIVRRGFPAPPSFHSDTLRGKPAGHYVDVVTNGIGKMFSYADRVSPHDRWAIVAYIRALQLSQNAPARHLGETRRGSITGQ